MSRHNKCGRCGNGGHNARTCHAPPRPAPEPTAPLGPFELCIPGRPRSPGYAPYGSVAPRVRELLDADGIIFSMRAAATRLGVSENSVNSTLRRALDRGEVAVFGHGVYALPEVAEAVRAAIVAANAARRSS